MTDTDLELLELAAKAAGIEFDPEASKPTKNGHFFGLWLVIHDEPHEGQRRRWNPLTDDGDALRLAVKLRFLIMPKALQDEVVVDWYFANEPPTESYGTDAYAATRRAIVRAAAEIARSKT